MSGSFARRHESLASIKEHIQKTITIAKAANSTLAPELVQQVNGAYCDILKAITLLKDGEADALEPDFSALEGHILDLARKIP